MFPQKTFLKSLKATELFRKHIFKLKVVNQEGVIILDLGESPGGNFSSNHSSWGSFFMLFLYLVHIAHLTKFTGGSPLLIKKIFEDLQNVWDLFGDFQHS